MSERFYSQFTHTSDTVKVSDVEFSIAYLNDEFEARVIDEVLSPGFEAIKNTMTLAQQISQTRFYHRPISFALRDRKYSKTPINANEHREAFLNGQEITQLKDARIWCVLATRSGLFLGFFIDGNHILYINDSITIVDIDTTGDNNGAGYKGGEDTYFTLSLVQNPDITIKQNSNSYTFMPEDLKDGEVVVPDGVVEIAPLAFKDCEAEYITIPEGVTTIARHAFEGCTRLVGISLPSTLKAIGTSAFSGCTALLEIVLPESVELVDRSTFESCISLRSAILPGVKRIAFCGFDACPSLVHVEMPKVEVLSSFAFARASSLAQINLPDTLTTVENGVFKECLSLKRLRIPPSVTEFDTHAFFATDNLEEVEVAEHFLEEFRKSVRMVHFSTPKNFLESVKIITY